MKLESLTTFTSSVVVCPAAKNAWCVGGRIVYLRSVFFKQKGKGSTLSPKLSIFKQGPNVFSGFGLFGDNSKSRGKLNTLSTLCLNWH